MQNKKQYILSELAAFLKADLIGDGQCLITSIAPLDKAVSGQISFLENPKYKEYLVTTKASALILRKSDAPNVSTNILIVADPYLAYAKLTSLFVHKPSLVTGVHATVICGENCSIDPTAKIDAYCVLGNEVRIAAGVSIGSGCVLGANVSIGENSQLNANITLYNDVEIGKRVLIHGGAVLGADGFGMANDRGKWVKIHQLGSVVVGDDVEIGANTTIDRGALEDTVIASGVKLDNQIQIGHNVRIGENTAIAGCTGIAGSVVIGKNCVLAGGVGINGHIEITDGVIVTAMSGVEKSITKPGVYSSGIPAKPHITWWRILARLLQLDDFAKRLSKLEKEVCNK